MTAVGPAVKLVALCWPTYDGVSLSVRPIDEFAANERYVPTQESRVFFYVLASALLK